jgi:hypothetical protein
MALENVVLLVVAATLVVVNAVLGTRVAEAIAALFGRRRRRREQPEAWADATPRISRDSGPPEHSVSRVRLTKGHDASASDSSSARVGHGRR